MLSRSLVLVALALVGCSRANAATETAGDAAPAGRKFGEPCVVDGDCASRVCFHKRANRDGRDGRESRDAGRDEALEKDGYCSLRCDSDKDCPVPPTKGKCGARGMCKRPE